MNFNGQHDLSPRRLPTVSRKPSAKVRSGKLLTYQPGCEPCCTSMAIACCLSMDRQLRLLASWPIWRAAVVILQALPTSPLLQRHVGMN